MANLKSAKKRAIQNKKRQLCNQARASELKTVTRKLMEAISDNDTSSAQVLMKLAESKIARAKGKGILQKNTASRKVSKLSKKFAALSKTK